MSLNSNEITVLASIEAAQQRKCFDNALKADIVYLRMQHHDTAGT